MRFWFRLFFYYGFAHYWPVSCFPVVSKEVRHHCRWESGAGGRVEKAGSDGRSLAGRRAEPEFMRVLVLVSHYPTEAFPNQGTFYRNWVEALMRCGAEVEVKVVAPWIPPGLARVWERVRRRQLEYRSRFCGTAPVGHVHFLRLPGNWHLPYCMAAAVRRRVAQRPDIVHSHYGFAAGLAGARVARRLGIRSVLTLHGSDINTVPLAGGKFRRWTRKAVLGNDAVVAVSEALRVRTCELFGRSPVHLPIGVNLRAYENLPAQLEARQQLGLPPDKKLLLYVGNVVESKGINELIEALKVTSPHRAWGVVVGSGPLVDLVQRTDRCTYCGRQPNERIPLYMRAADVFVLPSYSEGLPTVLVEAGAAGTPAIGTAVGGIPELLSQDRGRMIPPRSPELLAEAIRDCLNCPAEALARADHLRQYIREHYDADANARRMMVLYGDLIGKG